MFVDPLGLAVEPNERVGGQGEPPSFTQPVKQFGMGLGLGFGQEGFGRRAPLKVP